MKPKTSRYSKTSRDDAAFSQSMFLLLLGLGLIGGMLAALALKASTATSVQIEAPVYEEADEEDASFRMIQPRWAHEATLLPDGRVLISGGYKNLPASWFDADAPESELLLADVMEVFDPVTRLFSVATDDDIQTAETLGWGPMAVEQTVIELANTFPLSFDWSGVSIGGSVLDQEWDPSIDTIRRVFGTATTLDGTTGTSGDGSETENFHNRIFIAGGVDSEGNILEGATFNPARLETDKDDYFPEEEVILWGSGWKPGEEVDIFIIDDFGWLFDSTITADGNGNFIALPLFVVLWEHLGVTFDLTAIGTESWLVSTVQFTDSHQVTGIVPASGPASGGIGVSISGSGFGGNATFSVKFGSSDPVPATRESGNELSATIPPHAPGVVDVTVIATTQTGQQQPQSHEAILEAGFTYTAVAVTFTIHNDTHTYDGNPKGVTVTSDPEGVAHSISYSQNGNDVANPTNAGVYNVLVESTDPGFSGTTTGTLTINKADAVIDVQGTTVTYDGEAHGATGTAIGVNGEPLAGLDLGASFTNVPGGTANWTFTDVTGNYNDDAGSVEIVINKADATIMVEGTTVTYDGEAHGATGTATGVNGEPLAGLDLGASFTNVPGGTANWTFTDVTGNYNDDSGSVEIVINKADADIDVQGTTVTYDGNPHGASGTATSADGVTDLSSLLDLGDTFTDAGTHTANWSFPGDNNHNAASGSVTIQIDKADANIVVNGTTVTYDGEAHGATGTATGVNGEPLAGLDLGDSFTNVPGGTANWTFTDVTGNYNDDSGSVEIVINKADADIDVQGTTVTYDGNPHGASGTATSADGVTDLSSLLDLGDTFTDAGTHTANWSFPGDDNHNAASGSVTIQIDKADATIDVQGTTVTYDGNPHGASGTATSADGVTDLSSLLDLGDTFTFVPGGTAEWTFAGDNNHNEASGSVEIVITTAFAFSGFFQPIGGAVENGNGGTHDNPIRTYRMNSTIPVRFSAEWLDGTALTTGVQTLHAVMLSDEIAEDENIIDLIAATDAATTGNQFRLTGDEWHFNLSTRNTRNEHFEAGTWLLIARLKDGSTYSVYIALRD